MNTDPTHESAVMSGEQRGRHGIQGLADGFIPDIVRLDEIDQVIRIKTPDAIQRALEMSREEGLFVGISSRGERYLSMGAA